MLAAPKHRPSKALIFICLNNAVVETVHGDTKTADGSNKAMNNDTSHKSAITLIHICYVSKFEYVNSGHGSDWSSINLLMPIPSFPQPQTFKLN